MDAYESERARISRDDRPDRAGRRTTAGAPKFVGKVKSAAANIAVGKYLKLEASTVLGLEAEGGTATITDSGKFQMAYLIGPGLPATDDRMIATWEGNRWVVTRATSGGTGGGSTGNIPRCFCSPMPTPIAQISHDLLRFQSCTYNYQLVPATARDGFASLPGTGTGGMAWLSETLQDPFIGAFRYFLGCTFGQINIGYTYKNPMDGAHDFVSLGGYGWQEIETGGINTCHPFHFTLGNTTTGAGAVGNTLELSGA